MKKIVLSMFVVALFAGCSDSVMDDAAMLKKAEKAKKSDKVTMRHNGHLISVSKNAMDAHFKHGDELVITADDLAADLNDVFEAPYKWFFYNDEIDVIDNSLGSFVSGPDTPPIGDGSVQISVSGSQRRNLATYQFSGTPLVDITTLAFSTYNPSVGNGGSANRTGYLNFNVDFDGSDTWQKRLVFTPAPADVLQDTWQEWDCIDGGNALWHWSGGSTWPDGVVSTTRTWDDLIASFPDIRVRVTDSWFGIRVGSPYASGYTENIDAIKFNNMTFDFEN